MKTSMENLTNCLPFAKLSSMDSKIISDVMKELNKRSITSQKKKFGSKYSEEMRKRGLKGLAKRYGKTVEELEK